MRTVILCCPTRNELHNLTRLVPAWQEFADHIVIADQMSTDGSREYLSQFTNVRLIDNLDGKFNEKNRINLLVEAARTISTNAALLFLDADETLSANVMTSLEWKTFLDSPEGTTGYFRWVQLWNSAGQFLARGRVGTPVHMPYGFIDDGRPVVGTGVMHGPRGPGMSNPTRRFYFNEIVNLHFFLTNREVYRKKQNWYKYYWISGGSPKFHTNRNHNEYERTLPSDIDSSPIEWTKYYALKGIDLMSVWSSELLWYDVEILQHMGKKGERSLWLADIWNQDWEKMRVLAVEAGHDGLPSKPIKGPPAWIRSYTNWSLGRTTFASVFQKVGRFLKREMLP
jgi:hypothetical protein